MGLNEDTFITSSTNAAILDELLTKWEEMGYHFAPLSELADKL